MHREHPASDCQRCPLAETRTNVVWGIGNPHSNIMLLGEAPGYYEDISGEPFVGKSGALIDSLLLGAGLSRDTVYITNTVRCRPPDNRKPTPREIEACADWLRLELSTVQPSVIVCLGKYASLLCWPWLTKVPVGQSRALRLYDMEQPVIAVSTYHPAHALRDETGRVTKQIIRDLRRAKRYS